MITLTLVNMDQVAIERGYRWKTQTGENIFIGVTPETDVMFQSKFSAKTISLPLDRFLSRFRNDFRLTTDKPAGQR